MSLVLSGLGKPPAHPELSLMGFEPADLLTAVQAEFPDLYGWKVSVWIQYRPTLACIHVGEGTAAIQLHPVLNHPGTPWEVLRYILRHELLQIRIRPRELDGKRKSHPPEFWVAQEQVEPNAALLHAWLHFTLDQCLRPDKENECIRVNRRWKSLMTHRRFSVAEFVSFCGLESHAVGRGLAGL